MRMFYRVMKGIYQFAANLLSYIPTKYYCNRSTSDLVIAKSERVNCFETQCSYCFLSLICGICPSVICLRNGAISFVLLHCSSIL